MNTNKDPKRLWFILSLVCFLIGILVWVPNIIYNYGYSYWLWTLIINPLGILFGILGKSKFGVILNVIMTCSFFIFMLVGYLVNGLFGGKS